MSYEHLIMAVESTPGTWETPDLAFPYNKVAHTPGREYIEKRYGGKGRTVTQNLAAGFNPSGSIELDLFPDHMGRWLKCAGFSDITDSNPGTLAYEHGMLFEDVLALDSFSMQIKRSSSIATNVLAAIINKLTLKVSGGDVAMLAMDYLAKDEAPAGDNWNYDSGESSAAVISSPTYIGAALSPFMFFEGALILGGTPSLSSGQYSVSGGSTIAYVESLEVAIDNGAKQFHTIQDDPTPQGMPAEDLAISVKMDLDWSTIVDTYYGYFRNGTNASLQLTFTGGLIESGQNYMFQMTLPNLSFTEASFPDVEGSAKRRKQSVEAIAVEHASTDHAIGVTLRDSQSTY